MLFNNRTLRGLTTGDVDLTFRRWPVPRTKVGSQTRTSIGVVEVVSLVRVQIDDLTESRAMRAGFDSIDGLVAWVDKRGSGDLYEVTLRLAGPDPRVALRESTHLTAGDVVALSARLAGMDAAADRPWTEATLQVIGDNPETLAATLADKVGEDRKLFKRRVRRLKELGLTESLQVGYRLSPRCVAYLDARDSG